MFPWSSDPRLTPRGARLLSGTCLLLLAFALGPAPRPALAAALACAGLIVVDVAAAARRSGRARVEVRLPARVFAGEAIAVGPEGADESPGCVGFTMKLAGQSDGRSQPARISAQTLIAPHRGIHEVRGWSARFAGPLGLASARAAATGPTTLVVLPEPVSTTEARALGISPLGALAGPRTLGPAPEPSPAGLRAWRPGDPIRAVHGRASARRGRPVVREDEARGAPGITVELDRAVPPQELEVSLAALARIVLDAETERLTLHVRSQGFEVSIGPDAPPQRVGEALRFLAGAQCVTTPLHARGEVQVVELAHIARLGGLA